MGVILDVSHLRFAYRGRSPILEDVSFDLAAGQSLCLLGPNGTGKTTLLRCLLGICPPDGGRVSIDGENIRTLSRRRLAHMAAYVPQSSRVPFPFQVFDMVLMGRTPHIGMTSVATPHDEARAEAVLEQLGIAHLRERSFNEISGGERQLVLIARALCQDARLLIMDEPTASLDYGNQIRVLKIVNALCASGYGIIMTAHNPDHAFLAATQVAILNDGRITAIGLPSSVITSAALSDLYGASIAVVTAPVPGETSRKVTTCVPLL